MAKPPPKEKSVKISPAMREKLKYKSVKYCDFFIQCLERGDDEDRAAELADSMKFAEPKKTAPIDEALLDEKIAKMKKPDPLEEAKQLQERSRQEKMNSGQLVLFDVARQWTDAHHALPNDIVRSSLFTVRSTKAARRVFNDDVIYSYGSNVSITYTGIELRIEDDGVVWNGILDIFKRSPIGKTVKFSAYGFLKSIGWSTNGFYYKKLTECLSHLQANSVKFTSAKYGRVVSLSLIKKFEMPLKGEGECTVEVEPELVSLFINHQYTLLLKDKYSKLSAVAKKLFEYFSSHKDPYPLKVEAARDLCGSNVKKMSHWRMVVKRAIEELNENEVFPVIFYDHNIDSVCCNRDDRTNQQVEINL